VRSYTFQSCGNPKEKRHGNGPEGGVGGYADAYPELPLGDHSLIKNIKKLAYVFKKIF